MAIVSYRIYCDDCSADAVIHEDHMDESPWKINSKSQHSGLCPRCNPAIDDDDSEYDRSMEEVPFESLDNIGEAGADNLRKAGIITRKDVREASDEQILDVSWVGEGGLDSIRQEVQ